MYDYIRDRMTNLPIAGSSPAFAQKTDFANNWIDKADDLFVRLKACPVKTKCRANKQLATHRVEVNAGFFIMFSGAQSRLLGLSLFCF